MVKYQKINLEGFILLQQQFYQHSDNLGSIQKDVYGQLPQSVVNTLDNMIYIFCQKEDIDITTHELKQKVISNLNHLSDFDIDFLKERLQSIIFEVNSKERYEEPAIEKEFMSILIKVFY